MQTTALKQPNKLTTKLIFVTGGVISGLGKGIITASIGMLLKSQGFKVSIIKADMYLNIDAGTMNPLEHGEVFVTSDGLETDQDLGHYERFLNQDLKRHNYMTMGQVYFDVLTRERQLEFDGKCVEGHIHIPQEIIHKITTTIAKDNPDVLLVEVGGTVGEYQNMMFFEAIRRLKQTYPSDVFLVHLVYLITPSYLGEMKSKPAQASIYELYRLGLQPDFVICRSQVEADTKRKTTLAFNTGVPLDNIVSAPDVDTIYKIPEILKHQQLDTKIISHTNLKKPTPASAKNKYYATWHTALAKATQPHPVVNVAIAGKYFKSGDYKLEDSYVCVLEALKHAAWHLGVTPKIQWFDVERFETLPERQKLEAELAGYDGVIVPQGWGKRGVEGKVKCVEFARTTKIPYLGLCFGMQMAVIEYARNVLGYKNANSEEVDPATPYPVIHLMPDQKTYLAKHQFGSTIRLGTWPCVVKPKTQLHKLYSALQITERHRHRYEVNNTYRAELENAGLVISGTSPDGQLVEAIELPADIHPFFVGTQFHPEYTSRFLEPHPIFLGFITACAKSKTK